MADSSSDEHNSQQIIQEAESKLAQSGINAAQNVYQNALLDWVDDVTMGGGGEDGHNAGPDMVGSTSTSSSSGGSGGMSKIKGEIVQLWLSYAELNRRANLFKSATEVYEQAINCSVAGQVGKIWLEYARFLEERGRPRTTQKLYLRALVGEGDNGPSVKDSGDQDMLWKEFLRMMQTLRKNPDLTLEDLKKAVEQEHVAQSLGAGTGDPTGGGGTVPDASSNTHAEGRPAKRSRWDQKAPEKAVEIETLSAGNIDMAAGVLVTTSKNMPPEIEAAWHARDGGSPPSPPEPPLFTASPPKLGDPSGKDMLGNETALTLLRMLTAKTHDGKSVGSALLELCHACWTMTAIKEEEATKAYDCLEKNISTETDTLEANLESRASVAGGALAAVQQANEQERNQFNMYCVSQREQLQAKTAWEFRKLLYTQQLVLTSARLPGFDGPTVDSSVIAFQSNVCAVMHSAFYLRARVGEISHVNMLTKQLESLEKFVSQQVTVQPTIQPMQLQYPAHFQMQQMQMLPPQFSQPPPMGMPPPNMPINFPPPPAMPPNMMQPPGQQMIQPQHFMGINPQFQHGQTNNQR